MTMPFIFNTLAYANKLVETGMSKEQAEAQSLALHEALSEGTVAPGDLLILKTDLITRIEALRQDVSARVDTVKHDLIARIDAVKHDVDILKHKVNAMFWSVGLVLVLQVAQIGTTIYIIGRLP
jgi:hypothetical protein